MKSLILAILLVSSFANAGISLGEKFLLPNATYINAGGTVGTAVVAAQNIVSRTETGGKNFYLNSFSMEGFFNIISASATKIGSCSLQIPTGTTVATFNLTNTTTSEIDRVVVTPETPIVVSSSFAISCSNLTTTGTSYFIDYNGWEY